MTNPVMFPPKAAHKILPHFLAKHKLIFGVHFSVFFVKQTHQIQAVRDFPAHGLFAF